MKLLDLTSQEVSAVEQRSFKFEWVIPNLIEPNVKIFLGLKFVRSGFSGEKYQVDTC